MKIALIGATGFVGSAILKEALDRGHEVTAIVRHPEKLPTHAKLNPQKGDIYNGDEVALLVAGHDAVISAFNRGGESLISTISRCGDRGHHQRREAGRRQRFFGWEAPAASK